MLLIRADQIRILARQSLNYRLLQHAREAAPGICAEMSADHLRSVVDYCLERCDHYGLTNDYDVFRYLNLMLIFGSTFDQDQPWAAAPLSFRNPNGRMDLLMDHALLQHQADA